MGVCCCSLPIECCKTCSNNNTSWQEWNYREYVVVERYPKSPEEQRKEFIRDLNKLVEKWR